MASNLSSSFDMAAFLQLDDDEEEESCLSEPEDIQLDNYLARIVDSALTSSQEAEERRTEERAMTIQDKIRREKEAEKTAPSARLAPAKQQEDPKRIRYLAPGLDLFTRKFLNGFTADNLSLEVDFGYEKRRRLGEIGVPEQQIEELFSDPYVFVMYLCPEASSALIGNEDDFSKVCDYLFFYYSSCVDDLHCELFKKALFDLLKNYCYKWKLRLSHIYTALHNLGVNSKAINIEERFRNMMEARISAATIMHRRKGRPWQFALPKCHDFYLKRNLAEQNTSRPAGISPGATEADGEIRWQCTKNFVKLICELVVSFPDRCEFRARSDDWTNQLVFLYVVMLVGTDRHLMNDYSVCRDLVMLMHFQLDSFSYHQWSGKKAPGEFVGQESVNDEMTNACCDVSEVLAQVGSFEDCPEIKTWHQCELPRLPQFDAIDHHHNMVQRLKLIPPSHRGNQLKKNIAFLNLQHLVDPDEIQLPVRADIEDVCKMLENSHAVVKFRVLHQEHYTMFNVIRLIDLVIGNEPTDFTARRCLKIKEMRTILLDYSNKLRDDVRQTDRARVKEMISQVTSKWKILRDRYEADKITSGS